MREQTKKELLSYFRLLLERGEHMLDHRAHRAELFEIFANDNDNGEQIFETDLRQFLQASFDEWRQGLPEHVAKVCRSWDDWSYALEYKPLLDSLKP